MTVELKSEEIRRITETLKRERDSSYVDAIKLCRKYSGDGLKECKQFVDSLVAELQSENSERYKYLSKKSLGCGKTIVYLALAGLAIILLTTDFLSMTISLFR